MYFSPFDQTWRGKITKILQRTSTTYKLRYLRNWMKHSLEKVIIHRSMASDGRMVHKAHPHKLRRFQIPSDGEWLKAIRIRINDYIRRPGRSCSNLGAWQAPSDKASPGEDLEAVHIMAWMELAVACIQWNGLHEMLCMYTAIDEMRRLVSILWDRWDK